MSATDMILAGVDLETPGYRWFSGNGCVAEDGERRDVFVSGTLVGSFERGERGPRNLVLVALASDPSIHLGRLAEAFDVTTETIRLLRRLFQAEGAQGLWDRIQSGRPTKVTAGQRKRLEKMFAEGLSIREAHARLGKLGQGTVGRIHAAWSAVRATEQTKQEDSTERADQTELPLTEEAVNVEDRASAESNGAPAISAPEEGGKSATMNIAPAEVVSGRSVQHVGTWLMLACLERSGLYRRAAGICTEFLSVSLSALRVALDAVVMALTIGERCVEGVRRLMTPTASKLLRADHAPSASWVRRVLGGFSKDLGGARLHFGMASEYIEVARQQSQGAVVFYVDNHLRPYSGHRVIRKGWRMQDRRVLPGATDYYVHDEDGRPVLRLDVPSHDSLTDWLGPITHLLRRALPDDRILVAFDRAGAFPEELAALRNDGFEFVTYERRPYPTVSASALDQVVVTADGELRVGEARINLRKGRGRLRRISVRDSDERQINLLASSQESAARLIEIMRGRWRQENGFKHGVERWGINQLDGRQTVP